MNNARLRADVVVVVFAGDGKIEHARFVLTRCLPIKLKAPSLNAKDGMVAIEEMQIAYESLSIRSPENGIERAGVSLSVNASADIPLS